MDYIANLKAAIAAVEEQPELDLSYWRTRHTCGTLYCIGGLVATLPFFQAQGMEADGDGAPLAAEFGYGYAGDSLTHFFGTYGAYDEGDGEIGAYAVIFTGAGFGFWDHELSYPGQSDKDLALARLRRALAYQEALL